MQTKDSTYTTSDCLFPNLRFSSFIRARRHYLRLTEEQAAALAGLSICEWAAMESGWFPFNRNNIVFAVAGTLEVSHEVVEMLTTIE
jgi:hypothetical protein